MVYDADGDGKCDVCGQDIEEECGCTKRDADEIENRESEYYGR